MELSETANRKIDGPSYGISVLSFLTRYYIQSLLAISVVIRTRSFLARAASLNELVQIRVGKAVAWALSAATDVDVSQAAVIDERPHMIDRSTEPLRCFFEIE